MWGKHSSKDPSKSDETSKNHSDHCVKTKWNCHFKTLACFIWSHACSYCCTMHTYLDENYLTYGIDTYTSYYLIQYNSFQSKSTLAGRKKQPLIYTTTPFDNFPQPFYFSQFWTSPIEIEDKAWYIYSLKFNSTLPFWCGGGGWLPLVWKFFSIGVSTGWRRGKVVKSSLKLFWRDLVRMGNQGQGRRKKVFLPETFLTLKWVVL